MNLAPENLTFAGDGVMEIDGSTVTLDASARTNSFIDPAGVHPAEFNAPILWIEAKGDFVLSARVRVYLRATYDAAGLFAMVDERRWVKHVRENTDLGYPAIVDVVTDGFSDDSNGEPWPDAVVRLQMVRRGRLWCTHVAPDDGNWRMVRYFGLDWPETIRVGLTAQSPIGEGCRSRFDAPTFGPNPYSDVRAARV